MTAGIRLLTAGPLTVELRPGGPEPGECGLPLLGWQAGPGWRMAASTVAGGGLGPRHWVVNAQVSHGYARLDPEIHLAEVAAAHGLAGAGAGMLTAADVRLARPAEDGGVGVVATVGLGLPTLAAAPDETDETDGTVGPSVPGTINILVAVPAPLTDAALVGAIATVTEAKVQALFDAGFVCTGTASDAVVVAALHDAARTAGAEPEPFAGPRSRWGARIARAVHAAVFEGARAWPGSLG